MRSVQAPRRRRFARGAALLWAPQGCIKLQSEGLAEWGGDSLSLRFQAHSDGDKLSSPRRDELDATVWAPAREGNWVECCRDPEQYARDDSKRQIKRT